MLDCALAVYELGANTLATLLCVLFSVVCAITLFSVECAMLLLNLHLLCSVI